MRKIKEKEKDEVINSKT